MLRSNKSVFFTIFLHEDDRQCGFFRAGSIQGPELGIARLTFRIGRAR